MPRIFEALVCCIQNRKEYNGRPALAREKSFFDKVLLAISEIYSAPIAVLKCCKVSTILDSISA